jgi:hypothetical protein
MQAGNSTSHNGLLYHSVTIQAHLWTVVRINGDPDDPERSPRIDSVWAREQIKLYGRENPWVMAYILGLFPPTSLNALLGPDEVRAAMDRHLSPDAYSWSQKRLGVDVARFGDDRTVIFPRQGLAAFKPVVMYQQRANPIAARVAMAKAKWGSEMEFVDDTGTWGAGVIDNLITAGHSPVGIPFSAPAIDPRYRNRRAEMWMQMAEWVKRGAALPNIPELVAELTEPTYTFANGKFVLEEKDQIKKRTRALLTEALPLLSEHWGEVAHYTDIPLNVDVDGYLAAAESIRCYTVRIAEGTESTVEFLVAGGPRLVGYALFFVRANLHYSQSVQAMQDVVYLHPSVRGGTGARFLGYCDEQLRGGGVQVVYHHAKLAHPQLAAALTRLGYAPVETIYGKRLDLPVRTPLPPVAYRGYDEATHMREMSAILADIPWVDGGHTPETPAGLRAQHAGAANPWSAVDETNDLARTTRGTDLTDFTELMHASADVWAGEDGG